MLCATFRWIDLSFHNLNHFLKSSVRVRVVVFLLLVPDVVVRYLQRRSKDGTEQKQFIGYLLYTGIDCYCADDGDGVPHTFVSISIRLRQD